MGAEEIGWLARVDVRIHSPDVVQMLIRFVPAAAEPFLDAVGMEECRTGPKPMRASSKRTGLSD